MIADSVHATVESSGGVGGGDGGGGAGDGGGDGLALGGGKLGLAQGILQISRGAECKMPLIGAGAGDTHHHVPRVATCTNADG